MVVLAYVKAGLIPGRRMAGWPARKLTRKQQCEAVTGITRPRSIKSTASLSVLLLAALLNMRGFACARDQARGIW